MNRKQMSEEVAKLREPKSLKSNEDDFAPLEKVRTSKDFDAVYTHSTFSIHKDTSRNCYVVSQIEFNPISGHVGNMKEVYQDPNLGGAQEKFKIKMVTDVFSKFSA